MIQFVISAKEAPIVARLEFRVRLTLSQNIRAIVIILTISHLYNFHTQIFQESLKYYIVSGFYKKNSNFTSQCPRVSFSCIIFFFFLFRVIILNTSRKNDSTLSKINNDGERKKILGKGHVHRIDVAKYQGS